MSITLDGTLGITSVTGSASLCVAGPAFSYYASTGTTLSNAAYTKIIFDTKEFDTNNNFSTSKFLPTVAGYYQLSSSVSFNGTVNSEAVLSFYKNGLGFKSTYDSLMSSGGTYMVSGSCLIYLNGSTDYIEIYVYQNSTRNSIGGQASSWFSGAMIRSA